MLARREHSSFELQQKLLHKGYPSDQTAQVVQNLLAEGYISDKRFVECYARSRMARGYGPIRIAAELQARGVDKNLISDCLESATTDWVMQLEKVRIKKFGRNSPVDASVRAKQMRYLQYKGFSMEQIRTVLCSKNLFEPL